MSLQGKLSIGLGTLAVLGLCGCGALSLSSIFNEDFLGNVAGGARVASLPGEAPELLVRVENRTARTVQMTVSYRDAADQVQIYTTTIAPADNSATVLVCPISEITLGDIGDLKQPGAVVYLGDPTTVTALTDLPFVQVDPFGILLKEGVNYDCGDQITFTVQSSSATSSGYQTYAFFNRAS
jgi:hypothetical protein